MKKLLITLSILVAFLFSCVTYQTSGVVTGETYPPLSEDQNVKVILVGEAPDIEIIGVVQVLAASAYFDQIDKIVEEAKIKARSMGANIIVLEGKATLKQTVEGTPGYTDNKNVYHPGTSDSMNELPKYSFIAGRIKK